MLPELLLPAVLLLTGQAIPVQADVAPEDEIVVIANKLKKWRASVRFHDGVGSCKVKRSSGDPAIDKIGCDAMLQCWPQFLPRFEATTDKSLAKDLRERMTADANRDLGGCVKAQHDRLSAELAEKRANRETNGNHAQN